MRDISVIVLESLMDDSLSEADYSLIPLGGAIGAGAGALYGAGYSMIKYLHDKRLLNEKLKKCRDNSCKQKYERLKKRLYSLAKKQGVKRVASDALAGGSLGLLGGTRRAFHDPSMIY